MVNKIEPNHQYQSFRPISKSQIRNKTGRKPRNKSAHKRAVGDKTKIDQSRRRRAISAYKARPNKKKKK